MTGFNPLAMVGNKKTPAHSTFLHFPVNMPDALFLPCPIIDAHTPGATYFFTVVTYRRRSFLCDDDVRNALRDANQLTRENYPFVIEAWVLLPDHLHCIWKLPPGDADHSTR